MCFINTVLSNITYIPSENIINWPDKLSYINTIENYDEKYSASFKINYWLQHCDDVNNLTSF